MHRLLAGLTCLAAALFLVAPAIAQSTIKIGLILPYSGQFADTATQMDNGIKLYLAQKGETVAGKRIEIIRKDSGGPAPEVAKRLAQELVVRDHVDILAGFILTPNALAASDISEQAKKPMVIMNAATAIITTKSPYSVRVSMTVPQITEPFGQWVAKSGVKKAYTMVSDFGPGHDAEYRPPGRRRTDLLGRDGVAILGPVEPHSSAPVSRADRPIPASGVTWPAPRHARHRRRPSESGVWAAWA